MKKELLMKYAETDEDVYLLANILDKHDACRIRGHVTATGFLDLRVQGMLSNITRFFSEKHLLSGGYEDAERKMLMFFPERLNPSPEECMCVLKARFTPLRNLSHRDFLGALMSLGIERDNTGDILVSEGTAQIIIKREMADFLVTNFKKAGNTGIECEIIPLSELVIPEKKVKTVTDTLASARLDSACALAFSISRKKAAEYINSRKVYVNDLPAEKCDRPLMEGDKIRIKGLGRAFFKETGGLSRKGRIFVKFEVVGG